MPQSQQPVEGQRAMVSAILEHPAQHIVDVGAGDGKWGKLLHNIVKRIIAIEVWEPYIEKHNLRNHYDDVICADIRGFDGWYGNDVAIFGDVLEHMGRRDALAVIEGVKTARLDAYLTVPITPCPQNGTVYENPFETHVDQWTHGELIALGWKLLHKGPNPNRKVLIGTYRMNCGGEHE